MTSATVFPWNICLINTNWSPSLRKADAVADHSFAKHGRKFGREIADLVGMREQDQIWLRGFDDLFQYRAKAIRCVALK